MRAWVFFPIWARVAGVGGANSGGGGVRRCSMLRSRRLSKSHRSWSLISRRRSSSGQRRKKKYWFLPRRTRCCRCGALSDVDRLLQRLYYFEIYVAKKKTKSEVIYLQSSSASPIKSTSPHAPSGLPTRGFPVANHSIYSFFPVTLLSMPPSPSFRQAPSYTSHASSVSWSIQCSFVHSSSSATRSAFMVLLSWDEGSSAFLTER